MFALFKKKRDKEGIKSTFTVFGIISLIVLLLYAVSLAIPFLWSVVTSFRDDFDIGFQGYWAWPEPWVNNYSNVLDYFVVFVESGAGQREVGILEMAKNSVLYALGSAVFATLASLLVAYVCACFDFKFCKVIYVIVILQMIIPIVGSLPSEIKMATALHLIDNMFGMWIMKTYVTGLYFLVFYSSFKLIPKDFTEAAELDGANNFTVMVRIMIPFVRGSVYTVFLLNFITLWNDYQTPLIYMKTHPTLAYGLYLFQSGWYADETTTPRTLAGCILLAVPLFLIFVIFQERLLGNLTVGGLK